MAVSSSGATGSPFSDLYSSYPQGSHSPDPPYTCTDSSGRPVPRSPIIPRFLPRHCLPPSRVRDPSLPSPREGLPRNLVLKRMTLVVGVMPGSGKTSSAPTSLISRENASASCHPLSPSSLQRLTLLTLLSNIGLKLTFPCPRRKRFDQETGRQFHSLTKYRPL